MKVINLNLSGLDSDSSDNFQLSCQAHKRSAISFCISKECLGGSRLLCPLCTRTHKDNSQVDIAEVKKILDNGYSGVKRSMTTQLELTIMRVNQQVKKTLDFMKNQVDVCLKRVAPCFDEGFEFNDIQNQESLFQLYNVSKNSSSHYFSAICLSIEKRLQDLTQGQLYYDTLNQMSRMAFEQELKRFDLEQQIIHNLGQKASQAYEKLKNIDVFNNLELENQKDTRLFLVNDTNFYSISNFDEKGQRHGRTIEMPSLNNYFRGYLKNGQRYGRGLYIYSDGSYYYGDFSEDKKEGRGKFEKVDGSIYEGEWSNDKRNGTGKEIVNGEVVFEGIFEDDLRNGPGQEYIKDKKNYEQAIYEKGIKKSILK